MPENNPAPLIHFNLTDMTNYDVVKKIIGNVSPVGESHTDKQRLENLKETCDLVNRLVDDIDNVAYLNKDRAEYSMKVAGEYADDFLTNKLGIVK